MIAKIRSMGECHVQDKVLGCGDILIVSHGRQSLSLFPRAVANPPDANFALTQISPAASCTMRNTSISWGLPVLILLSSLRTRWCSLTLSQGRLFTSDAGALSICPSLSPYHPFPPGSTNYPQNTRWIPAQQLCRAWPPCSQPVRGNDTRSGGVRSAARRSSEWEEGARGFLPSRLDVPV